MAPRKSVRSLEDSCLPIAVTFIKTIVDNHCQKAEFEEAKMIDDLKMVVKYVPANLHDKLRDMHLCDVIQEFDKDGSVDKFQINTLLQSSSETSREGTLMTLFKRLMSKIGIVKKGNSATETLSADESERHFYQRKAYFNRLMSVIDLLRIKTLVINGQPAYIERKYSELFDRMTNLEVFSCVDSWISVGEAGFDCRKLLRPHPALSNLTSFTMGFCTDKILSAICENCKAIRIIDVENNENWRSTISDFSIPSLVECENLENVNLRGAAVSPEGFFELLRETNSISLFKVSGLEVCLDQVLEEIEASDNQLPGSGIETETVTKGRFITFRTEMCLDQVLEEIEATDNQLPGSGIETEMVTEGRSITFRTFQLKELICFNPGGKQLHSMVKYFPLLTKVSFDCQSSTLHRDFSALSKLRELKSVEFNFNNCGPNVVGEILSTCPSVVAVTLHHRDASIINTSLTDVAQHCPNIEKLHVYEPAKCSDAEIMPKLQCTPNSFLKLTELIWCRPTLVSAQRVLRQAKNVQTVSFLSDALSDEFFESVFERNPLNQLKRLNVSCFKALRHTLSCDMVEQMVVSYEQLTKFDLTFSPFPVKNEEKYRQVLEFICENNYDVDLGIFKWTDSKWVNIS